jgi:DNA polymerase
MSFCFHDYETQSNLDLTVCGTLRYVLDPSTRLLLWSWAIDDAPVKLWCPDLSAELEPEVWAYVKGRMAAFGPAPTEIAHFFEMPGNYAVAHNSGFDRACWQQIGTPDNGFPRIEIENTLCSQAQSQASNLPGSLDFAGKALGLGTKTIGGKAIMKRFADRAQPLPGSRADIEALIANGRTREQAVAAAIASWELYLDYSVQDTELMREVWQCTRPLDASEWQEYWVSERINDRGKMVDLDVARGAVLYREEEAAFVIEQIKEVTGGAITSPTLTKQINEWLYDRLPDDLAETMVKARDEEGYVTRLTGSKDIMTRLIEDIAVSDTPPGDEVIELLELLQYGRASSAVKFQKMLDQEVDSRIYNAYVFNGAGQSGRFSSKNLQEHNLVRDKLPNELDVLDVIAAQVDINKLRHIPLSKKPADIERAAAGKTPVSMVLSRAIRPTFVAPKGKKFVWGDWKAVEARVNPWLADTRDADEAVLEPFRVSDADPTAPDLYVLNAESIFHIPADVIWERYMNGDDEADGYRKAGKVACIAEGQLVLTDTGLVPIEKVTLDMKVWDGQSFVSHQGSMFMGYKDVYEYDGLTATLDHIVWTEEAGETWFGEAIRRGYHHVKSGAGRAPVRVGGDHLSGATVPATEVEDVLCAMSLHRLPDGEVHLSGQLAAREVAWVRQVRTTPASSEVARPAFNRREGSLHEPERPELLSVRWPRSGVPVRIGNESWGVDSAEPRAIPRIGDRPRRRERALRSGQPALGDRAPAAIEQARLKDCGELGLHPERVALRVQHGAPETVRGVDARGNHQPSSRRGSRDPERVAYYRGKAAVYDIANAGPLHRFTVSDCLVHNCLALGFLGSLGALKAMARNYGMRLTDEDARLIVDGWRDRNRWARRFGDKCEAAAFSAIRHPGSIHTAGKVRYQYLPGLMGGTLVSYLPDGRPIVYPKAKIQKIEKFDQMQDAIVYLKGMGRRSAWSGLFVENNTQGAAASLLRQTLVRLENEVPQDEAMTVLHTHDEVGCEVPDAMASGFAERLENVMVSGFDWTEGLPLAAEITTDWYYHK